MALGSGNPQDRGLFNGQLVHRGVRSAACSFPFPKTWR
jgi:hypothetical protein